MSKIACGIFIGIVGLLLVIGGVLIGLAYSGYIWSETTGILDFPINLKTILDSTLFL